MAQHSAHLHGQKCRYCEAAFGSWEELKRHQGDTHKIWECGKCFLAFNGSIKSTSTRCTNASSAARPLATKQAAASTNSARTTHGSAKTMTARTRLIRGLCANITRSRHTMHMNVTNAIRRSTHGRRTGITRWTHMTCGSALSVTASYRPALHSANIVCRNMVKDED
jgi:hypothetical protein